LQSVLNGAMPQDLTCTCWHD